MLVNSQSEHRLQGVNKEKVIVVNRRVDFDYIFIGFIGILIFVLLLIFSLFYEILSLLFKSIVNSFSSEV
ncbi:MAG: hypothetical protein RMJ67_08300 [Elusimicrobiota bacterium]|nr:hypothetical protein [Endomicrobiia bacterium]MDW8166496.1 hypothetical protein [Elusimicrobiota bacterium]